MSSDNKELTACEIEKAYVIKALQTRKAKDVAKELGIRLESMTSLLISWGTSAPRIKADFRSKHMKNNPQETSKQLARSLSITIDLAYRLKREARA